MTWLTLYVAILLGKALLAWRYASRYPPITHFSGYPVVHVYQAILSGDPDLENALESNLLVLSEAHFIWLIDQDDQEAARITASIAQRHPSVQITVNVSAQPPSGINPKLYKLEAARDLASTGIYLVIDDDTRLSQKSLDALVCALNRADLATGLPFYRDSDNLFGRLLGQFVNNNSALTYLPALQFAPPISINGMCYAMRVEMLSKIGGFAPILRHLTDDLAVANRLRDCGGTIEQTPYPQEISTTLDSIPRYMAQMHRWYLFALLLMRQQSVGMNIVIIASYGLPPLFLLLAIPYGFMHPSWLFLTFFASTLVFRAAVLCTLQRRLSGIIRHRPFESLASELLQTLHLIHALLIRSIRWRSRRYRVFDNDHFESY